MADISLRASVRTIIGKKVGALRRAGIIPANIYGRGIESLPVQLDIREFRDALSAAGSTGVVDLHVSGDSGPDGGKSHPVLIEHVSTHPATGKVLHVDLRQVDLDRPVRTAVPIVFTGESAAVRDEGGVFVTSLDSLDVEALPRLLPHEIEVDIARLAEVDAQIVVGDLKLPQGVTVHNDAEAVLARVVASKLEQEVAAEEAEAAAEAAAAAEEEGAVAADGEAETSDEAAAGDERAAEDTTTEGAKSE